MSWYNEYKKIKNSYLLNIFFMGIIFWIIISLYLWCDTWIKNLCEQIPYLRECQMAELHVLPHEISAFIYIYIYIHIYIDIDWLLYLG